MQLSSINYTYRVGLNNKAKVNNNAQFQTAPAKAYAMPNFAHYAPVLSSLSFTGGYSLDLGQTVKNLDKMSDLNGTNFPPDVREMAQEVLDNGNPENKTLIDIHKEKYALLNECYDLDDAKALFDEFKDVLSDTEVDYRDNSFIAKVKRGESNNFNADEDLTLQLLKLYWAQGFSLTDLKNYADNTNLYHTLNKLNIPLLDKDYAHILKLSDKEYNERLTNEMAQKRMEANDRIAQKEQGEPVYVPRGPLSDTHKKHISEGLLKYYAQNPDKAVEKSKRQSQYFSQNPEQRLIMAKVANHAWHKTQEGKSLQKHMIKFFKKQNIKVDKNVYGLDSEKMTPAQQQAIKDFWKRNPWAKDKFSVAMTKAWNEVKSFYETESEFVASQEGNNPAAYRFKVTPRAYVDNIKQYCINNDINIEGIDFESIKDYSSTKSQSMAFLLLDDYVFDKNPKLKDIMTSSLAGALLCMKNRIHNDTFPKEICSDKELLNTMEKMINQLFYSRTDDVAPTQMARLVGTEEIMYLLTVLVYVVSNSNDYENSIKIFEYIEELINQSYTLLNSPLANASTEYYYFITGQQPLASYSTTHSF